MITTSRALPVAVALTFVLASCGGSSDGDAGDVEAPVTVAETAPAEGDDFTEGDGETDADAEAVEEAPVETEDAPDEPAATEPADVEEPAPEETDAEEEPAPDAEADAAAGVDVALSEWAINAPAEYTAGEITFNASNGGSFPHELVVIEGEGYEALPLAEGGAVIEEELPTGALIGRTGRLGGGDTEALVVTLAPGSYVLVCNLGGGNNSHAGQGQRLDITVT